MASKKGEIFIFIIPAPYQVWDRLQPESSSAVGPEKTGQINRIMA